MYRTPDKWGRPDMAEPATVAGSPAPQNAVDAMLAPIRELGLEPYVAELEQYGYTIIPPELVAAPEFVERVRDAVLRVVRERTGVEHILDRSGDAGSYETFPTRSDQYLLYYLLFEDEVFEEWLENPVLAAVIDYMMRGQVHLSSLLSFVKWRDEHAKPGDPATFLHSDGTGGLRWEYCRPRTASSATLRSVSPTTRARTAASRWCLATRPRARAGRGGGPCGPRRRACGFAGRLARQHLARRVPEAHRRPAAEPDELPLSPGAQDPGTLRRRPCRPRCWRGAARVSAA